MSATIYFYKSLNSGNFNVEYNWIKDQILRDKHLYDKSLPTKHNE